jgi:hypothetical protein
MLKRVGLDVGHEKRLAYIRPGPSWNGNANGEVGWPAAAHFDLLADQTCVAHLVRNPIAVLGSRVGNDKLAPEFSPPTVRDFVSNTLGGIPRFSSSLERALWFVTSWDQLVTAAPDHGLKYERFRIEDLAIAETLKQFVDFISPGRSRKLADLLHAATSLAPNHGSIGSSALLSWDVVPQSESGDYLRHMAVRDGYSTARSERRDPPCQR